MSQWHSRIVDTGKFNSCGVEVFAAFPISTLDWYKPMVLYTVDVLILFITFVQTLMFAWPTHMPVPKGMKAPVKTFYTVNSLGLEFGAQLEFQIILMAGRLARQKAKCLMCTS